MAYETSWESLDEHTAPQWYRDAGFGLFVHFTPSGFVDDPTDYEVADLTPPTAFDAAEWAALAERAGAHYVVFTAFHRGGFANYPSELTDYSATDPNGPFDIVTPLADALRDRGIKLGLYFNWHATPPDLTEDPSWASGPEPSTPDRVRELVERYNPDLLWADSGWFPAADHGALELLAWYYNRADDRDQPVCVNDRYGVETRQEWVSTDFKWFRETDTTSHEPGVRYPAFWYDEEALLAAAGGDRGHGDFYTAERQVMSAVSSHPWECCLPISRRWLWHHGRESKAPDELIRLLVATVTRNGNLILNSSPRPDGSLLPGDRHVLESIGDWLATNGEAIYGTTPRHGPSNGTITAFEPAIEWEAWPRDDWTELCDCLSSDGPWWFTERNGVTYAIRDRWPEGRVELDGIRPAADASVHLLGASDALEWAPTDGGICIELPATLPTHRWATLRIPTDDG